MEKIRKILIFLIVILFGYGIIANIEHTISIRKTYEYSFDTSIEMTNIKKSVTTMQNDIEKLKKIENSSLGKDVLDAYIQMLENVNQNISSYSFMSYSGTIKLTQKDLYQMLYDYGKINYINMLNVYKKLVEVNPSLENGKQELTKNIYSMLLFSNYVYESLLNNYVYTSIKNENKNIVSTILSLYEEKLNTIDDISQLVLSTKIESGEENE